MLMQKFQNCPPEQQNKEHPKSTNINGEKQTNIFVELFFAQFCGVKSFHAFLITCLFKSRGTVTTAKRNGMGISPPGTNAMKGSGDSNVTSLIGALNLSFWLSLQWFCNRKEQNMLMGMD